MVSLGVAALAALRTVRSVAKLPPAEAMSPPSPTMYAATFLERMGIYRFFGNATRMVLREVARRPLRTLISSCGIAASMGIVVLGSFQNDAVQEFMDTMFGASMREDVSLTLLRPIPESAVANFKSLPGVREAEGGRVVPVRFHAGHRWRDGSMQGHARGEHLRQLVEYPSHVIRLTDKTFAISSKLAEILEVRVGDTLEVEVREGAHLHANLIVTQLVDDTVGLSGHLSLDTLARMLR